MSDASCDRFEREGLLRQEQGLPLDDEHFATCPDCLAARAVYDRLRQDLAMLGLDAQPAADWQVKVRAAIDERSTSAPLPWAAKTTTSKRLSWMWIPTGLAAATLAFVLARPLMTSPPTYSVRGEPTVGVLPLPTEGARRGGTPDPARGGELVLTIGDRFIVQADTAGAPFAELRVYLNDALIVRCPGDAVCRREGTWLEVTLDATVGRYEPILFTAPRPLTLPRGTVNADTDAAATAGATVTIEPSIRVY